MEILFGIVEFACISCIFPIRHPSSAFIRSGVRGLYALKMYYGNTVSPSLSYFQTLIIIYRENDSLRVFENMILVIKLVYLQCHLYNTTHESVNIEVLHRVFAPPFWKGLRRPIEYIIKHAPR